MLLARHLPEHDAGALGGRAGGFLGRADDAAHQAGPALQQPPRHADWQTYIGEQVQVQTPACNVDTGEGTLP